VKISTASVMGMLIGAAMGLIATARIQLPAALQATMMIREYAWWIVVLSMLIPLTDYLTGVRTTLVGYVTGHPFRHLAGFFMGVSVGLGFFLLISPKLPA
jgi:membrane protein YqaA with SNARE-associated domain